MNDRARQIGSGYAHAACASGFAAVAAVVIWAGLDEPRALFYAFVLQPLLLLAAAWLFATLPALAARRSRHASWLRRGPDRARAAWRAPRPGAAHADCRCASGAICRAG